MQLVALHKPVDFEIFLPPTNHTVYMINTHRHALEQLSQDCMVRLWLLNVCFTHDGCWLQCFTTTYSINILVSHVEFTRGIKNQCTYTCSNTALKSCSHLIFHIL